MRNKVVRTAASIKQRISFEQKFKTANQKYDYLLARVVSWVDGLWQR